MALMNTNLVTALVVVLCLPLQACSQPTGTSLKDEKKMNTQQGQVVYLDVALFAYLERPIFDVMLNGKDIGVGGGQPQRGSGGLMTGVPIKLGPQVMTWRDAGNGNTSKAANIPKLDSVDPQLRYLGVHIYPDNTVELIPERFWPEKSEKGEAINRAWELKHGK